jgi:5'-3' exonuclease
MAELDLLIDGDQFLYKAACGVEKEVRWDEENHILYSNLEDAWGCLKESINALIEKFTPTDSVFCLTGKHNFRKELYPSYKAQRQGSRKPLCYADLSQRLRESFKTVSYDKLEADDILGILATKPSNRRKIIVSQDKDMKTIPATVFNGNEVVTYSEAEADYNHMFQTLCGDTSDGYPGCPGVGPVKAGKLLSGAAYYWSPVVDTFRAAGYTEDDALVQARLARILRASDWDDEKKEPILWTPPTVH